MAEDVNLVLRGNLSLSVSSYRAPKSVTSEAQDGYPHCKASNLILLNSKQWSPMSKTNPKPGGPSNVVKSQTASWTSQPLAGQPEDHIAGSGAPIPTDYRTTHSHEPMQVKSRRESIATGPNRKPCCIKYTIRIIVSEFMGSPSLVVPEPKGHMRFH